MSVQIGSCAQFITLRNFLSKEPDDLVRKLTRQHSRFSDSPPQESQIKAWHNCFEVLHKTFAGFPEDFQKNVWAVFEYVLPLHKPGTERFRREQHHIRPDVILISADCALVLEFKRMDQASEYVYKQALKYKRRLDKYHVGSRDLRREALLVLTGTRGFSGEYYDEKEHDTARGCSADLLGETVVSIMGARARKHEDIRKWIGSEFKDLRA